MWKRRLHLMFEKQKMKGCSVRHMWKVAQFRMQLVSVDAIRGVWEGVACILDFA